LEPKSLRKYFSIFDLNIVEIVCPIDGTFLQWPYIRTLKVVQDHIMNKNKDLSHDMKRILSHLDSFLWIGIRQNTNVYPSSSKNTEEEFFTEITLMNHLSFITILREDI